jgi:hypothetical protein
MLRSVSELFDYVLTAKDGEIGRCRDFLFDDRHWAARYMVADTGKWLPGRKVLISILSLGEPDWTSRHFPVNLTKEQIEESPSLDEDAPVSRRYETEMFDYYHWPYYWAGADVWGGGPYPLAYAAATPVRKPETAPDEHPEESHLRSVKEVKGYHIRATDGEIGHVEDFIVDDADWVLRYMVVDTRNWLPGRKVLVTPLWIESIEWAERQVQVDLTKEGVKESPEYDPAQPVNREYEVQLYDYYGRPHYWEK